MLNVVSSKSVSHKDPPMKDGPGDVCSLNRLQSTSFCPVSSHCPGWVLIKQSKQQTNKQRGGEVKRVLLRIKSLMDTKGVSYWGRGGGGEEWGGGSSELSTPSPTKFYQIWHFTLFINSQNSVHRLSICHFHQFSFAEVLHVLEPHSYFSKSADSC